MGRPTVARWPSRVRAVLCRGTAEVPPLARPEKALEYRDTIAQLLRECEGSFLRVHEELTTRGFPLSYPALTAFCRRHGIGHAPPQPAGRDDFAPGQEMQHDTSPHDLHLGGQVRAQIASLVLGYSRMLFFQVYPQFRRFECKVFLTEALHYLDGACQTCLIDNTHVVVLKGTGRDMIPVPEMAAFAERFGFTFAAHAVGDANRSGRVERMFRFIQRGFLPGRRFADWADANRQARAWCDRVNAQPKRHLQASPRDLFATEHPALRRLPRWIPEPYLLHERLVDIEGYVTLHTNHYSVPTPQRAGACRPASGRPGSGLTGHPERPRPRRPGSRERPGHARGPETPAEFDRDGILAALDRYQGNRRAAARTLGIDRSTLRRRLRRQVRLKRDAVRRFRRRMRRYRRAFADGGLSTERLSTSVQSWVAHAKDGQTYRLRHALFNDLVFAVCG